MKLTIHKALQPVLALAMLAVHFTSAAQLADKAAAQAMVAKGVAAIQAEGWKALDVEATP